MTINFKYFHKYGGGSDGVFLFSAAAPIVVGDYVRSLFYFAVLCVLSSFAIISQWKRELIALQLLCSECHVTVIVL